MKPSLLKRYLSFATLFAVAAVLYLSGATAALDRAFEDLRFRLVRHDPAPRVAVVAIDSESLARLDVWPWPRGYHAKVVENLFAAGANQVAFDVDFSSGSDDPREDAAFEAVLRAHDGRVVLPVFSQFGAHGADPDQVAVSGPLSRFQAHVRLATINVLADSDGHVRRYPVEGRYLGRRVPSMASALEPGAPTLQRLFSIDYGIDVNRIPTVSFADVLTGRFDPAIVAGRSVIVGATATELSDAFAVPRYAMLPGCVVQALALESLASARTLRPVGPLFVLTLTLTLILAIAALHESLTWKLALLATGLGALALAALSTLIQAVSPFLLDVSPMLIALAGGFALGLVRNVDREALSLLVQDRKIRQTESLMRHVVANSFDAIVTVDEVGSIVTFNRVACKMFGCDEPAAIGRPVAQFVELPDVDLGPGRAGVAHGPRRALYEAEGKTASGYRFPVEMAMTSIAAEGVNRRVLFLRDITERKAQQEKLRHQATHDALTELPNRNLLLERVDHALVTARHHVWPVSLLLLDLDRFKEINDTLGHHIGDLLLRKIARRLESVLREQDTIARLGGDEFAVLLPATGLEGARQSARKLIASLEEPFPVEGLSLQVDTSVGIALFPEHGTGAPTLIRRADVAMYVAKRERLGVVVYDPDQDFTSIRLLALTGDLRKAIQNEELELHYQPKVCALSGRPVGVEALCRWNHPEHGRISPDEFIGLAEHAGLIGPLTHWVVETALLQWAAWRRQGIRLGLSINLSARNLLDEQLMPTLLRVMKTTGAPRSGLTLEITESSIMEDPKRSLEVLTGLHELGIRIAIDDFGTGYSSLGYLKKLPAREIKIDKSFVTEMDRLPDDRTIVHSTIELAHNLGLEVVAEGVEREAVWDELRRLGCDQGQGYLFARPMTGEALAAWFERHAPRTESRDEPVESDAAAQTG